MRRKLWIGAWCAALLLAAYSGAAWWMLRGTGAYRMGTRLGGILSGSWQYTALAAVILIVILLMTGKLFRPKKRAAIWNAEDEGKFAPAGPTEILPEDEGKVPPAGPTEVLPEDGEKFAPSGPTEVLPEDEGKFAPAGPTEILPETAEETGGLCPKCGAAWAPGQKFCKECGAKLGGETR